MIDAGCGSGRLTAALLDRLPRGRVLALDRSRNMLEVARTNLRPAYGDRVQFVQAALPIVPVAGWADVVFSTATFHWIRDHRALFAQIFARPASRRTAARPMRRRTQSGPRPRPGRSR